MSRYHFEIVSGSDDDEDTTAILRKEFMDFERTPNDPNLITSSRAIGLNEDSGGGSLRCSVTRTPRDHPKVASLQQRSGLLTMMRGPFQSIVTPGSVVFACTIHWYT